MEFDKFDQNWALKTWAALKLVRLRK